MQIFKAPAFLSSAFQSINQRLWPNEVPEGGNGVVIASNEAAPVRSNSMVRYWRAAQAEPDQALVDAILCGFTGIQSFLPTNEATTGDIMIVPMLMALGYYPWQAQIEEDGNRPDYRLTPSTGLEIKKFSGGYDRRANTDFLTGDAMNRRFQNIAHQMVTYLDELGFSTMLYSNGAFWWRLERDEAGELYSMRFNMRLVYNTLRNGFRAPQLAHFVPLFHSGAFASGNNYQARIHCGLRQQIGPVGSVWIKDLNNGPGVSHFTGL